MTTAANLFNRDHIALARSISECRLPLTLCLRKAGLGSILSMGKALFW